MHFLIMTYLKVRLNIFSVLKFNERAIRLYNSLNFKVTGEFMGKTVKGDMKFIFMEREL
jgi:[ribosomal protein S18]-alanine N-acetyltransferase